MMKNLFSVNFPENTITASKTTMKKASVPNSPEYKELMKLMKQNPTFTIAEKEIRRAASKNTYKGLDTPFILKYISIQDNAEELKCQYSKAAAMGNFPLVRKWFLDTFKNFNMADAKEELAEATLSEIAKASTSAAEEKISELSLAS